ncbi:hypothetical protein SAMN05216360_102376 [Methylobacterium phyllostachyos]|uniref:Uncharacterized protein n=1 Tax=Methylobacterium phyllostachyos TaxID=582672 RepID=A0A1G9U2K9_9HYPH|nr:hypothetical protein SAMN05216360_102376 [Methylobacterium phyllostachyos]
MSKRACAVRVHSAGVGCCLTWPMIAIVKAAWVPTKMKRSMGVDPFDIAIRMPENRGGVDPACEATGPRPTRASDAVIDAASVTGDVRCL